MTLSSVRVGAPSPVAPRDTQATVRFLTNDPSAIDYWPSFSPDGESVLFSRTCGGPRAWGLFVVPGAGGEAGRLDTAWLPVAATRARWSRQQDTIAFTGASVDGKNALWLIDADGARPRRLAPAGLSDQVFYPSWYPDGRRLAAMDARRKAIVQIDRERLTVVPLTDPAQVLAGMPSVSPDGAWIAFAGQKNVGQAYDQTRNSIWLTTDSGEPRPVEETPGRGRTPAWSPDGEWLAFESARGAASGRYAVFVIRRDGTGLRQITSNELNASHPSWSPDRRRLVFSARHTKGSDATGVAVVEVSIP